MNEDPIARWLRNVRVLITQQDYDWIHLVVGPEGSGKSSLAFSLCKQVDPSFSTDRIVFSGEDFEKCLEKSKPGQAILIDEGSLLLFSRDAMTTETKRTVKAFTTCRNFNQFIICCIPRIWIIDRYLREERVKSLSRVVSRGWAWYYGKPKVKLIRKDRRNTAITIWPNPDVKAHFGDASKLYPEEWAEYLRKKKAAALGGKKSDRKKQRRICTSCGHEWSSVQEGKLVICTCGERAGKIKGRSCNNMQLSENENDIGNS